MLKSTHVSLHNSNNCTEALEKHGKQTGNDTPFPLEDATSQKSSLWQRARHCKESGTRALLPAVLYLELPSSAFAFYLAVCLAVIAVLELTLGAFSFLCRICRSRQRTSCVCFSFWWAERVLVSLYLSLPSDSSCPRNPALSSSRVLSRQTHCVLM